MSETSAGKVRVETPHATFAIDQNGSGIDVGQRVTLVVPGADLMRSSIGDEPIGENSVTGIIKGLEYAGSVILLVLDLGNGEELKVEQHESL